MALTSRRFTWLITLPWLFCVSASAGEAELRDAVSHFASQLLPQAVSPGDVEKAWKSYGEPITLHDPPVGAERAARLLRFLGVPIQHLAPPLDDATVRAVAVANLDQDLPVFVWCAGSNPFILEGYFQQGGDTYFSTYDPRQGTFFQTRIAYNILLDADPISGGIEAVFTVQPVVPLHVIGCGAVTYNFLARELDPSPGQPVNVCKAIMQIAPLLQADEGVLALDPLTFGGQTYTFLAVLPATTSYPAAMSRVEDTLGAWYAVVQGNLFPLFQVSPEGGVAYDGALDLHERLSILYSCKNLANLLGSELISPAEAARAENAYNYQGWILFHLFLSRRDAFEKVLKELAPVYDRQTSPDFLAAAGGDDMPDRMTGVIYDVSVEGLLLVDVPSDAYRFVVERAVAQHRDIVWGRAFATAMDQGMNAEQCGFWAKQAAARYDRLACMAHAHPVVASILTGVGTTLGPRIIGALNTLQSDPQLISEVDSLWAILDEAAPDGEADLSAASNTVGTLLKPEFNTISNRLYEDTRNDTQFWGELALSVFTPLITHMVEESVGASLAAPFFYANIGYILGDFLGNTSSISEKCERAKFAKDIEALIRSKLIDGSSSIRASFERQIENGDRVDGQALLEFRDLVHFLLMLNTYYYKTVSDGFRFQTDIVGSDFLFPIWGISDPAPEAARYLDMAKQSDAKASAWRNSTVANDTLRRTQEWAWAQRSHPLVMDAPDLVDAGAEFRSFSPAAQHAGNPISVSCAVRNAGTRPAAACTVSFLLSQDAVISPSADYVLCLTTLPALAPAGSSSLGVSANIPASVPPGDYWVGWFIDSSAAVSESNEGNNSAYVSTSRLQVLNQSGGASPVALNVTVETVQNTACTITLNASDPDGDPLTYVVASRPSHGSLTDSQGATISSTPYRLPNGSNRVTYTPAHDYYGQDAFLFWADDGISPHSNSAFVNITVHQYDYPPTAFDVTATAFKNLTTRIALDAVDANPTDTLDYIITSRPAHGALRDPGNSQTIASTPYTLVAHGSHVDYSPATDYLGADSFSYRANDGDAYSNYADVSITVKEGNRAPTAYDHAFVTTSATPLHVTMDATDPDWGDDLNFTILSKPTHGALVNPVGNVSITTVPYTLPYQDNVVVYTSQSGYSGSDTFTFRVSDGAAQSNVATNTIEVGPPEQVEIWPTEIIDGSNRPYGLSAATTPDGRPAVSYRMDGQLRYAEYNAATDAWDIVVVDGANTISQYFTSLAFGPDGQPSIAYRSDTNDKPCYAKRTNGQWTHSPIPDPDTEAGHGCCLRFSPITGQPSVTYMCLGPDPERVKLATFNGSSWTIETVEVGSMTYYNRVTHEIDDAGKVHIVYWLSDHPTNSTWKGIRYVRKVSGAWAGTMLHQVSNGSYVKRPETAKLGPTTLGLAHYDTNSGDDNFRGVCYLSCSNGSWSGVSDVTPGSVSTSEPIAIARATLTIANYAEANQPGIACALYKEGTDLKQVKYLYRASGQWRLKLIGNGQGAWVKEVAVGYEGSGWPYAAFGNNTDTALVLARPRTTLTTRANPTEAGTVSRSPDKQYYTGCESVMLTATPNSGWAFLNWTGDVPAGMETLNPVSVVMDTKKSVVANFGRVFTLSTSATPSSGGSVVRVPDQPLYPSGTSVELQARPAPGAVFAGWTGDVPAGHEADNPLALTMDRNRALTAHFNVDTTSPTVILEQDSGQPDPTHSMPIQFAVVFSESVSGFDRNDVIIEGTAPGITFDVSGSAAAYTLAVTGATGSGTIMPRIAAGAALDAAGNASLASTSTDNIVTYDRDAPSVTINQALGQSDPTHELPILFDVTFSESVTGFDTGHVQMNGTATGLTYSVNGSGASYSVIVTAASQDGTIVPSIPAGACTDLAGNPNRASTSNDNSVTLERTSPTVAMTSTSPDPTNTSPIVVTVTFSETVTDFGEHDILRSRAALRDFAGSGATYTFSLVPSSDGPVTADIPAGVAQDAAGNRNLAATRFSRLYDASPPNAPLVVGTSPTNDTTPTWTWTPAGGGNGTYRYKLDNSDLTTGATETTATTYTPSSPLTAAVHTLYVQERDGVANWSSSGSFAITIDTTPPNVPVTTGTTPTNDTTPTWTWTPGGGGNGTYRYKLDNSDLITGATETTATSYTPSSPLTAAAHTLYVQERDSAGNWSGSGSFAITIDTTPPTVAMSSTALEPTNVSPIVVTVTFSESVTGFSVGDVTPGNGTVSNFSGSGATYSFNLTPSGQGGVTAGIAAGVCQDVAGNANTAAPQFSRTYDSIAPTVLMDSTASEPTSTSPIPVTVTFSEPVTGFDATDITTSNGAVTNFAGSGGAYCFNLTPAGQGLVTADIVAGVCLDAAGNGNTAAPQFSRTYNTNPTQQTRYVDRDNEAGPWDGLTWATAFQTIQQGVNAAYTAGGGEVWVAEGTYTGAVDPVVTMRENVDIYGGFIGIGPGGGETSLEQRDWRSHVSAIDGQGARRCVLGADNATLDGFTVTAGFADIGGGMYNYSASPTVANCIFTGNSTGSVDGWGGGGIGNVDSSPIITDCVFSDNSAGWGGGGIHNLGSSPEVSRCVFANNETTFQGGGGGICYADTSSGTVTNCTFQANSGDNGGGIYITAESVPELINCTFTGNSFRSNGGGAICINQTGSPLITNCIFWGDQPVEISPGYTVTYSLVQGGYPGTGNRNADPRFVNQAAGDLRLRTGSPCIDSGTTGPDDDIAGISRPQRAGWDMGAHEFVTAVLSIVRRSANPTRGTTVGYTVTFNEAVTGVDKTDFTLATTGVTGAYVYSVSGTGATRTVTVATGTGNGTIRLDVRDDDTIMNGPSNPLGGPGVGNGDYTMGEIYTVDKTRPTVSLWSVALSTTNLSPIPVVVTFNEPVTGFVATDITVVNAKVSNFAGSGAAYTFDLVPIGDGTVTARVLAGVAGDAAGNVNLASNTLTRTYDGTPPRVSSVVRTSPNPTRATSVLYRVTFSGVVTGVDATDFSLTTTGVSGAYVYSVTGAGAVYTVRVATGTGSGTIRLDVVDDDSIKDGATNPLGGAGAGNGDFTGGEVYTVDKTRPTVSMSSTAPNPTNLSPIPVTVTFSEPVTGFVATDIVATNGSVSNFAGSGANYSFDLVPSVPGTVRADIPAGRAQDAAGNTNTAAPSFIRTYQP